MSTESIALAPPLKPMPLSAAVAVFGASAVVFSGIAFLGIPGLPRLGFSPFATFSVALGLPLALMLAAALAAYRLETRPWTWVAFRDRMRLGRMPASGWLWTLAVSIFGFERSNPWALTAAIVICFAAIGLERREKTRALPLAMGVLLFGLAVWAVPWFVGVLPQITYYTQPQFLGDFMGLIRPDSFMGIDLAGQWWLVLYYLLFLLVLNIGGEELWWRGYILPRQELVHGRYTWIVHGILWTAFHIFWDSTLGASLNRLPFMLALAFVCQHNRNTWPGIVGHFVSNSPIFLLIVSGVAA